MDRTRKANREDHEATLQYRTQNEALHEAELIEEKLIQLQATVSQLEQTPQGMAELQRRINSSASANDSPMTPRPSFATSCVFGWKGTCRKQNRLYILRDRLATVQLREEVTLSLVLPGNDDLTRRDHRSQFGS